MVETIRVHASERPLLGLLRTVDWMNGQDSVVVMTSVRPSIPRDRTQPYVEADSSNPKVD